jgi:hypothetical protein
LLVIPPEQNSRAVGSIPHNDMEQLFEDLGIPIKCAVPFLKEGLQVKDLPYLTEPELESLMPSEEQRHKLLTLVKRKL